MSVLERQTLIDYSILASAALAVAGAFALASCARGDEPRPSPQSPARGVPGWTTAGPREPQPAPPAPRRDFATPPTDGPDEPTTTPPGPAPEPPSPSIPPPVPVAARPVKAKTTTTTSTESEGAGIVISGNSAPVNFYSPGVDAAAPAQQQAQPGATVVPASMVLAAAAPASPGLLRSMAQRVSALCPGRAAPAVAAPAAYAIQPVTLLQAVPLQAVQPVQYVQPATVLVQQAPQYVPLAAPQVVQAAPQYAVAPTPVAPKKCRLFGR